MSIKYILRGLAVALTCFLTGCLDRPSLQTETFLFDPPLAGLSTMTASGHRVLSIRSLQVAAPFDGRNFVYRTGDFSYDRDPYAKFMARPSDAMISPITTWWRASTTLSTIGESGSALKPNTLVEIQVSQLYGDLRPSLPAQAVLTMRFVFFDATNGLPGKSFLEKEYAREIPLKSRTPAALVEGWNTALAQILGTAAEDVGRTDANAGKP
jgi:hypothetical protein